MNKTLQVWGVGTAFWNNPNYVYNLYTEAVQMYSSMAGTNISLMNHMLFCVIIMTSVPYGN